MKNNFIIFITFSFLLIFVSNSFSDEFEFLTPEIKVSENGTKIEATNGIKIVDKNTIITAESFKYDKINSILELNDNIKFFDNLNDVEIYSDKIIYNKKTNIISTSGPSYVTIEKKYFIDSIDLIYDKNNHFLSSNKKTELKDNTGNTFVLEKFKFFTLNKILKGKNVLYTDPISNFYSMSNIMVDLKLNKFSGKDLQIDFNNSLFKNSENEPRLKGNAINANTNQAKISKGVFTTCKKKDGCPPWLISAEEVVHDKTKKTINYKNAWLKVYDVPVLYFPKFFHPDPTVKRQSGFLIPSFAESSNLGSSINLPYFQAISDNTDLTFTPRIFFDQSLFQLEYRQVNKNSNHILDTSFVNSKKNSPKKQVKSHFFSNSLIDLNLSNFNSSEMKINLEKTTNDNYLKTYQIDSPLIKNPSVLNSYLDFDVSREDLSININLEVYEDLSKITSDRYEYIYPNFNITKELDVDSDNRFYLSTSGYQKQYNTNVKDSTLNNNLLIESQDSYTKLGTKNNYNILFKNVNSKGKNSNIFKEDNTHKFFTTFLYQTSYPLKKDSIKYDNYFEPILMLRYSPNKTKNMMYKDRRLTIDNIFALDRIGESAAVEGGQSLTLGGKYSKKNKDQTDLFSANLATVYRDKENPDLPLKTNLGKKTSDIVGNIKFKPSSFLDLDYDFSLDNNLNQTNYDLIKTSFNVNKFVTTFEYLEEKNMIGNESYISNKTAYNFSDQHNLSFGTRKNKKTNVTEFYNLIYEYKNDCLKAAIEYNKDYYTDGDLKPQETIFFSMTIMPFGKANSPNIGR